MQKSCAGNYSLATAAAAAAAAVSTWLIAVCKALHRKAATFSTVLGRLSYHFWRFSQNLLSRQLAKSKYVYVSLEKYIRAASFHQLIRFLYLRGLNNK